MSKKLFSKEEIDRLKQNKYVKNISPKAITYTDEFKLYFIAEYTNGKITRDIFNQAGLDVEILGEERIKNARKRWMKAYKNEGVLGLRDTRKTNSGRPLERELTLEDQLAKKDAEIEYLKAELELVKKLDLEERQVNNRKLRPCQIYEIIQNIIEKFQLKKVVSHLCKITKVSRSGYYLYLQKREVRLEREIKDLADRDIILKAFHVRGYKKGSRSIYMTLRNKFGILFNRKKIQRLMRKYQIICPIRKANPYRRMAKETKEHRIVPNLLKRQFKQGIVGKVLLTDITYMPYNDGMAYLSTVKDGSTNEILAYQLSENLKLDIATDTIHQLMNNSNITLAKDAFIHSDQGVHYTSPTFQKLIRKYGLNQSMSRRGNCWDNAPQESFFGHMKDEIDYKTCNTFGELYNLIDDYMHYYNYERYQWNLKKLTPVEYRNQLLAA